MDSGQDRLLQFDRDLLSGKNICSSEGIFVNFPPSLKKPFQMKGLGLIICRQGNFQFSLNQKKHFAGAGESLFIPEDGEFQVLQESEDMEVRILIYQIEPIRDIMGNLVVSMYMYSRLTPEEPSCVWSTGEEEEIVKYMSLLDNVLQSEENSFKLYEQKLLLLALTYRICSIYNRKLVNDGREVGGRKNEVFIHLIQLIEKYYMQERGVEFYADKLCLSPKYLSAVSKSICGYTVQELVFKAIIRKSISLLKNTQKDIQEISNAFGFPNASYFGTFFKKQVGFHRSNIGRIFKRLFFFAVGKIACIAQSRNNVRMFVDFRIDGSAPDCRLVFRKYILYMIDSLLAGDNRSNMNFGRVAFGQHCLVTKFHTPSCCQHRVGDNQRFVINAGRSDIFYVYIEF